jgi:hypothetical protein
MANGLGVALLPRPRLFGGLSVQDESSSVFPSLREAAPSRVPRARPGP